jgi:excisionase family DNA binding protein
MRTLLTKKATAERLGVHPEHLMKLVRQGRFPKPMRLGESFRHAVRFAEDEVEAWVAQKLAAREPAQPTGEHHARV